MKVTVKRKKNVGMLRQQPHSDVGVKKHIAYNGSRRMRATFVRTQAIPRRSKRRVS